MWVDDDIFPGPNNKNYIMYSHILQQNFDKNLNFILKSNTDTAMAYFKSPLFEATLQVCNYFKLITDVYRANEKNEKDKECAGPNLIKKFINLTQNFKDI